MTRNRKRAFYFIYAAAWLSMLLSLVLMLNGRILMDKAFILAKSDAYTVIALLGCTAVILIIALVLTIRTPVLIVLPPEKAP